MPELFGVTFPDGAVTELGRHPTGGGSRVYRIEMKGSRGVLFSRERLRDYESMKERLFENVIRSHDPIVVCFEDDPARQGVPGQWHRVDGDSSELAGDTDLQALRRFLSPGWWFIYARRSRAAISREDLFTCWDAPPPWNRLPSAELRFLLAAGVDDDPWLFWQAPDAAEAE